MSHDKDARFDTLCIHGGQSPEPVTGAVMPPISQASTYAQKSPGKHTGYEYSRTQNPTRMAYERCVADLEGGTQGSAFASGLAATSTILELLDSGSHVIAMDDMYGGTYRLFEKVRKRSAGLQFSYVDLRDRQALENAIRPETRLIWVETPTNPLLKLTDLDMVAEVARKHKLIAVCDNTFASSYNQQPLSHGFDLVMHSATKYLNGHSDMVGGMVVAGERRDLPQQMAVLQNSVGAGAGPVGVAYAQTAAGTGSLPAGNGWSAGGTSGKPAPTREPVLSVHYRGAWGTGLLTSFTVIAGGRFVWRHREPNLGGPASPMHTRTGALPGRATADLLRRIEALRPQPYRLIDSPVVEFQWRGADGGQREHSCYPVRHSPCTGVLDAVDALAKRYGAAAK